MRRENGHRTTSIGDLDGLATLDLAQQFTGPLPELAYADCDHVLWVAHNCAGVATDVPVAFPPTNGFAITKGEGRVVA